MSRRRTIAVHELRTQLTSAPFAALILLLVAAISTLNPVAMIPGGADADLPIRAVANSVYALAPTFAMSGFFVYPFFASLMAGLSVLRDEEAGVSELLHSTPLTSAEYVWSKFAGVFAALLVAIGMHVLVVIAFRETGIGGVARGPFDGTAYLIASGLFVVPGVLWIAGLTFVIGARTKSPMAVYALPVALLVLEFALFWNWHPRTIDPVLDSALMIVDPTGLRWLTHALFADDHDMAWYNSAPLRVDWIIASGRVLTMALPLASVALLARRGTQTATTAVRLASVRRAARGVRRVFSKRGIAAGLERHVNPTSLQSSASATRTFGTLDNLSMQRRPPTVLRATMTVLAAELRALRKHPSGYLFSVFLFAVVAEVGGAEADAYGSTSVLTAGGVAINALPAVTLLTCLFLLFVIVESLYRDRATGFDAIALSSPVPTTAFIAGKALATLVVVTVFTAVCIASGSILVLAQSDRAVSLWPLVLVFGAVLGPTYIVWTAFVTAVMSVVQSRTTALAIGFVALLLTAAQFIRGGLTWVTNWPLWGALRWTEFAVFPLDGNALLLNRMLALGLALAFFAAARLLFVRTERDPAAARARWTPAAVGRLALRAAPLLALPLFTGGVLAVRVQNAHDGAAAERAAAAYETSNQQQWATVVPALIRHVDATVTLDPPRGHVVIEGTYDMVNRTSGPMTSLPFTIPPAFGPVRWQVRGIPAIPSGADGLQVLALAAPLAPGEAVRVGFRYGAHINAGISRNGGPVDAFVLPSSVLLSTHRGDFLPVPGYRRTGGATLRAIGSDVGAADDSEYFNRGWSFTATMRVRAPRSLTLNGVGRRTASITTDNERLTTWETDEPVSALALVGAKYAVRRAAGVAVYHHPDHTQSLDVIMKTLAAARQRYSAWFHPYPWDELRLSEYADLSSQATSYPTNIAFSEGLGFLTTTGHDGGLAFAVTAHEAAHQWWGHLLTAGTGPGTGLLVEGMADYATLLLYGAEYGESAQRSFAVLLENQYLDAREPATERPVLDTRELSSADEAVLQKKGAWVMWMVHNSLGADRTFAALRAFITEHRAPGRFATPEALLRTLRTHASDSTQFDAQIAHWFRSTRLPQFHLRNAQCTPVEREWSCDATLHNAGDGDALVDVAAMQGDRVVVSGRVRTSVKAGASVNVLWRLQEQPDRLVVDPDIRVLQARRANATAVPKRRPRETPATSVLPHPNRPAT